MYTSIKSLHVELTDKCNAACPICVSKIPLTGKQQPWLLKREIFLEDFKDIVRPNDLINIQKINFCGNYGEPLAAKDLIPIIQYVWKHNPKTFIELASNGHPRNEDWWWDLCEVVIGKPFKIVFGIDGINQKQHELYRRNTNLDKILGNAITFINNGGHAEWQYLIFKHNEDEVEQARELARHYGFKNFYPVATERFWDGDKSTYTYKNKKYTLERSTTIPNRKVYETDKDIKCFAMAMQEAYIDCMGYITPCCYLGLYSYAVLAGRSMDFHNQNELMEMFSNMDLERLQGRKKGLGKVVKDPWFKDLVLMHQKRMPERCYRVCGIDINKKEYA